MPCGLARRRVSTFLASLIAAVALAPGLAAQPLQEIAFVSGRDGNWEIYRMHGDGSGQTRLTHNDAADTAPQWSPNGRYILFQSTRDGNDEIYSMAPDGSQQMNLTSNAATDYNARCSPDGNTIAFVRVMGDGNHDIWTMDPNGNNQRDLTPVEGVDRWPEWSPDSKWILFQSSRRGMPQIYKMRRDGGGIVQLSTAKGGAGDARWSPDGERIVYACDETGDGEIWTMRADGREQRQLTFAEGMDRDPRWSPDGQWILFKSERDGNEEIYLTPANVGVHVNLTRNPAADMEAVWSDDGAQILFRSDRDGNEEVYVMGFDGSTPRPLSRAPGSDWDAVYGPRIQAPPAAVAAQPVGPGIIAFDRRFGFLYRGPEQRQDGSEIYVVNPDGTNEREMQMGPPRWPVDPAISPDRTRLAFLKGPNPENQELWLCDIGGGNETRLTGPGPNADPNWSPDGSRILFRFRLRAEADRPLPGRRTYAWINTDGSGFQELPVSAYDAALSRDGQHIVWSICETDKPPDYKDYPAYLWVSDANGGNLRQLTMGEPYVHEGAEWSPDGTTIAFIRTKLREPGKELRLVPVDGRQPPRTVLEDIRVNAPELAWSPDGREIAFTSAAGRWGPNRVGQDLWVVTLGPPAPPVRQVNGAIRGLPAAQAQWCERLDWR